MYMISRKSQSSIFNHYHDLISVMYNNFLLLDARLGLINCADDTRLMSTINQFHYTSTEMINNINQEPTNIHWLLAQRLSLNVSETKIRDPSLKLSRLKKLSILTFE